MKISITGRRLEITEAARTQIEKRVGRIERVLHDSAVSTQCTISQQRGVYVFDVTIHARADHMLHAVARSAHLATAVSLATDRVGQQAQKLADRWKRRRRSPAASRKRTASQAPSRAARAAEPEA